MNASVRTQTILWIIALAGGPWSHAAPIQAPLRQSEQFTVVDTRPTDRLLAGRLRSKSGEDLNRLDADALLLSAERVREALLPELGCSPDGAGRIRLFLYPANHPDDLIRVISGYSPGEWDYRVEIPDQIDGMKLIRGMVHALLLEIANRGQGPRSAELPLWLVEGLTLHLSAITRKDLVVGSVPLGSMLRIVRETPRNLPGRDRVSALDSLHRTRQILRASRVLSFSELSYPTPELLTAEGLPLYQASAHLFVYELLQMKDGRRNLIRMLQELPQCWNWETALLHGFASHFSRLLDVEKKWSVEVMAFTARGPAQMWSKGVCLDNLDEVLGVPSQIRVTAEMLPQRTTLTLQQVISHWNYSAQVPLLRQKVALLEALRFHAPAEVVALIDGYRRALGGYLQKRDQVTRAPETRMQQPGVLASLVAQDANKELELLDKQRQALRSENGLTVTSTISR